MRRETQPERIVCGNGNRDVFTNKLKDIDTNTSTLHNDLLQKATVWPQQRFIR